MPSRRFSVDEGSTGAFRKSGVNRRRDMSAGALSNGLNPSSVRQEISSRIARVAEVRWFKYQQTLYSLLESPFTPAINSASAILDPG
jgi:hypothetical protein